MTKIEKKIDNRPFKEVYLSLSRFDARSFRDEIASRGISVAAVSRWKTGSRLPQRKHIPLIIESFSAIGIETSAKTLFG